MALMPPRPFGYVTAKAQAKRHAAYVSPLDGFASFCEEQRKRVMRKCRRSVRRVQQAHRRAVDTEGTDVQFVESRKA
jgi:hypothetical protein